MYKTRPQVDHQASLIWSRPKDDKERCKKGFMIAKLYRDIKEYDIAKKYLALYLTVEDSYAPAHRLMAELLEAGSGRPGNTAVTCDLEKAINYYRRSFELDKQQKDLTKKICSLYARIDGDKQQFQDWLDLADLYYPGDKDVFSFKEKLMASASADGSPARAGAPGQYELLLLKELEECPDDAQLSYKLLQHYEGARQYTKAYRHILAAVEQGAVDLQQFYSHYEWHACAVRHLEAHIMRGDGSSSAIAWKLYLTVLLTFCDLALRNRSVAEATAAVLRLDTALANVAFVQHVTVMPSADYFKREMESQLYYCLGVLVVKKGDAHKRAAAALFVASFYGEGQPRNGAALLCDAIRSSEYSPEDVIAQRLLNQWTYRKIQTGYLLLQWMDSNEKMHLLTRIRQQYCSAQGKKEIYSSLLSDPGQRGQGGHANGGLTSHFLSTSRLQSVLDVDVGSSATLEAELSALVRRASGASFVCSLHDLVWLALQRYGTSAAPELDNASAQPPYDFLEAVLAGLRTGTLSSCFESSEPESLCRMDAEVFLYATVRTTLLKLREVNMERGTSLSADGTECSGAAQAWQLPAVLAPSMCTEDQADWWQAVQTCCAQRSQARGSAAARFDVRRLRRVVQRGIETVRLVIPHPFSVQLTCHVAKCLEQRISEAKSEVSTWEYEERLSHLRAWADHYWESALDVLGRMNRSLIVKTPKDPLFVAYDAQLTAQQVDALLNEVRAYMMVASALGDAEYVGALPGSGCDEANGDELDVQHGSFLTAVSEQLGDDSFNRTPIIRGSPLRNRAANSTLISTSSADRQRGMQSSGRAVHALENRVQALCVTVDTRLKAVEEEQKALSGRSGDVASDVRALNDEQRSMSSRVSDVLSELRLLKEEQRALVAKIGDTHSEVRWVKEEQRALASRSSDIIDHLRTVKDEQRALPSKVELMGELRALKSLVEALRSDVQQQKFASGGVATATVAPGYAAVPPLIQQPGLGGLPPPLPFSAGLPSGSQPLIQQQPSPFFPPLFNIGQPPVVPPFMQLGTYPHVESSSGKVKASGGRGLGGDRSGRATDREEEASAEDYNEDDYYENDDGEWVDEQAADTEQIYFGDTTDEGQEYVYDGAQDSDDKLVQHWPYGADAGVEGRHTVTYKPPKSSATAADASMSAAGPSATVSPARQSRPMPQPGFFAQPTSTPEKSNSSIMMPPNVVLGKDLQSYDSPAALLKNPTPAPALVVQVPRNVAAAAVATAAAGHMPMVQSTGTTAASPLPQKWLPKSSVSASTVGTSSVPDTDQADADDEDGDNAGDRSSIHDPYYEPVIDLPPEVDLVTGEEGEDVAFEGRARLFRMVDKEWKERGTGHVKILLAGAGRAHRARIVMRRDQTHKVCANHYILPGMELQPMGATDNTWIWKAIDFADGKSEETFAIRFKAADVAADFKRAFAESRQKTGVSNKSVAAPVEAAQKEETKPTSLSELFKPAAGSWECPGCLLQHKPPAIKCPACGASKPGAAAVGLAAVGAAAPLGSSSLACLLAGGTTVEKSGKDTAAPQALADAKPSLLGAAPTAAQAAAQRVPFSFGGLGLASVDTSKSPFGFGQAALHPFSTPGFPSAAAQKPLFGAAPISTSAGTAAPLLRAPATSARVVAQPATLTSGAAATSGISEPSLNAQKSLLGGDQTRAGVFLTPAQSLAAPLPVLSASGVSVLPALGQKPLLDATAAAAAVDTGIASSAPSQKSLFGAAVASGAATTVTASSSASALFQKPLFGLAAASAASVVPSASASALLQKPVFGQPTAAASKSLLSKPLFGMASVASGQSAAACVQPPVSSSIIGQLLSQPLSGLTKPSTGETDKPSLFQGFSFNALSTKSPMPASSTLPASEKAAGFAFGGGVPLLSTQPSPLAMGKTQSAAEKSTSDTSLFLRSRATSEGEKSDGNTSVEEYEPQVDFKPVIPLPDLIEAKTGEEEEESLFSERAKLFRFDKPSNQWKERGVGILKVLKAQDKCQYRLVMRRDQIFKLCANHLLTADTDLRHMPGSSRSWCWFASDFSEGSVSYEQLAARFANEDLAQQFKQVINECCENLKRKPSKESAVVKSGAGGEAQGAPVGAAVDSKSEPSLADLFKPAGGAWSCDSCYVSNSGSAQRCVCCQALKRGVAQAPPQAEHQSEGQQPAIPATTGVKFGLSAAPLFGGSASQSSGISWSSMVASAAGKEFVFGGARGPPASSSTGGFTFGLSKGPQSAGSGQGQGLGGGAAAGTNAKGATEGPRSPVLSKSFGSADEPTSPDLYVNESGEDDHISFEPVIKLPEVVKLQTGEENEDIVYAHRAKLFRFCNGEWKERGIGDVKLLKHRDTGRVRIIMRRDQILKLCLNHYVVSNMELNPMAGSNGKTLIWAAIDYSDADESAVQQFALRFKDPEAAAAFNQAFDQAKVSKEPVSGTPQACLPGPPVGSSTPSVHGMVTAASVTPASVTAADVFGSPRLQSPGSVFGTAGSLLMASPRLQSPGSVFGAGSGTSTASPLACLPNRRIGDEEEEAEVVYVGEEKPSAEQVRMARQLQLPDAFYLYEGRAPCPGCAGCEEQEEAYLDRLFRGVRLSRHHAEHPDNAASSSSPAASASPWPNEAHTAAIVAPVSSSSAAAEAPARADADVGGGDDMKNAMFTSQTASLSFAALASAASAAGGAFASTSAGSSGPGPGRGRSFLWAGAGSSLFGGNKSAPRAHDMGGTRDEDDEEGDEDPEQNTDDVQFKPVLEKLPDLIDVITGEENDIVEYCQRCKLFRYDAPAKQAGASNGGPNQGGANQWKERGVGEIKLLRNPATGIVRVVMRRDQVLKLACNHRLTADMQLLPLMTSEQAWMWHAMDFSEGALRHEQLAAKFKTIALASEFKQAFDRCKASLGAASVLARAAGRAETITLPSSGSDVTASCKASAAEMEALVSDSQESAVPRGSSSEGSPGECGRDVLFEKQCTASELLDSGHKILGMGTVVVTRDSTTSETVNVIMTTGNGDVLFSGAVRCGCTLERGNAKNSRYLPVRSGTISRKIQLGFSSSAAAQELDGIVQDLPDGSQ